MSGSFSMILDHEAPIWDQLLSSESHHFLGMDRCCHDNSCISCKHWCIQVLPILQLHLQCILCLLLVDV